MFKKKKNQSTTPVHGTKNWFQKLTGLISDILKYYTDNRSFFITTNIILFFLVYWIFGSDLIGSSQERILTVFFGLSFIYAIVTTIGTSEFLKQLTGTRGESSIWRYLLVEISAFIGIWLFCFWTFVKMPDVITDLYQAVQYIFFPLFLLTVPYNAIGWHGIRLIKENEARLNGLYCLVCNKKVPDDAIWCPFCCNVVSKNFPCPNCGSIISPGWAYCPKCGRIENPLHLKKKK